MLFKKYKLYLFNFTDLKRIFNNKMVSSLCWTVIELLTVLVIPNVIMYFYRPFPQWICFLQLILKPALACRLLLLMDAIVIARYIIIFWLQNLLKFQDDFWCYFVNIWIVMFRFLKYFFGVPHLATFIFFIFKCNT